MEYQELTYFLEHLGKDPSRLIFEDELTGIYNRRFLLHYFQSKVPWDALEDHPLSLIMIDVDHFKQVNDTYGHQVGDEALIWFANLLKELAGEDSLAVRYAGDEFMILLPFVDKAPALRMGERLLQRVREEPFRLDEQDGTLHMTLSIGIASAPEDAQSGKGLVQKADTALYYAKMTGRDRLANAGEVGWEQVLAKTAIYQLEEVKIVGRKLQLAQVAEALRKFSQRQSQFLVVEGAAGMGKSDFLEAIHLNLAKSKIWQVKVSGFPQEMFRPYYLITSILVSILNQRPDKGTGALETLSPKEITHLAHILPQLGGTEKAPPGEDEKVQREAIFTTLAHFIPKAVNSRPLILFIDDLHYSDEATLILLRRLMLRGEIPLFICGTSTETHEFKVEEQMVPLERFYETYHRELGVKKLTLTPLTATDIARHIKGIFTNARLPENFEKDLAQISQGNPLFLSEILRKLVLDQKITLVGQQWVIQSLEEGYLPRSLEEIVSQKIAALDEENRQLLEQVSALGEDVSLSVLIGSSGKMEAKVLEFIDQAVAQGLLSTDFQLNDETIRFLSERILEITYGSIEEGRKQEMHERIGNYQETLYEKRLLPSAATLAYHFKRSADQERARKYEHFLAAWNSKIFNAQEAIDYREERPDEFPAAEAPLNSADLAKVPTVIRLLLGAARNIKLYPQGSDSVINAIRQLKEAIDGILENNDLLSIVQREQALVINDQEIDATESKFGAEPFFKFLSHLELRGIGFHRGLPEQELEVLLGAFCHVSPKMIDPSFWQSFSAEHDLTHIDLKQVRYSMTGGPEGRAVDEKTPEKTDTPASLEISSQPHADEQKLDQEELSQIPEIIQGLLRAAKTIRLYPLESKAISDSVEQLMEALQSILTRRPVLALALVRNSLLVNGIKIDTSDFKTLADTFVKFLDTIEINSLCFLQHITSHELETFVRALGEFSDAKLDSEFWKRFAEDKRLSSILLNKHLYEILEEIRAEAALEDSERDLAEQEPMEKIPKEEEAEPPTKKPFETFLEVLEDRLPDLLLKGDEKMVQHTVKRLFEGFQVRDHSTRQKVIDVCRGTLESLTLATKHQLSRLLADPLLVAFSEEKEPKVLVEIASLLKLMAISFIQFAEYPSASRVLFHLQRRYRQLDEAKDERVPLLSKALDIKLEPPTQKLIVDDLKSSDPSRQKEAAQLVGSLGQVAVPMLIDIIKQEEDYRARKIATILLEELGPKAAKRLKRELVLEISAEERLRILEVIDTLTSDLRDELLLLLGDEDPQVREAAFRLAERLNESYVVELLLDYAKCQESSLATAAIKCLGRLKMQSAVGELFSLLNSTKEEEQLIACCRALGQIADPASVEHLAKILAPKSRFGLRKGRSARVRAAAAFALGQIAHPSVAEVLAPFVEDRDPRIREIARTVVNNAESSAPS